MIKKNMKISATIALVLSQCITESYAFSSQIQNRINSIARVSSAPTTLFADVTDTDMPQPTPTPRPSEGMEIEHEEPEDAILHIAPKAMIRLRELQKQSGDEIVLRMGVRNGGCSGLSYVMDFSTRDKIEEDDAVDEYSSEKIVCVVDAKSMLYLYGLELDYSDELIGGGFKFFNPNAEESCGCGSSFGV